MKSGAWDEAREEKLKAECVAHMDAAVEEYLRTPRQDIDSMFDFLFARMPRTLEAQREIARRYAAPDEQSQSEQAKRYAASSGH
jgi:pyruvate dehydrogenase E1 component alpha subunit